ncbi:MAG TPA: DinB family protein [Candidatus Eisenbacteria bacterium]
MTHIPVDDGLRWLLWRQFGAAIDMLGNAITACPDDVWSDRTRRPEYWYTAYHTLFWLDLYLHGPVEGFRPLPPFGLEELDPAGVLPDRVYTRSELMTYLEHGRERCREAVAGLDAEGAARPLRFGWGHTTYLELLLYNMRHVQHHAAQLNLILRQSVDDAPRWVGITKHPGPGIPA